MSQLTLTIELGNDAMQTPADIAHALQHLAMVLNSREVAGYPFRPAIESSGTVRDGNGNAIAMWSVTK